MFWLSIFRLAAIGTTLVASLVALALSAHLLSVTLTVDFFFTFSALAVATACISLVSLVPMLVLGSRRLFTSLVAFELGWLSVLWVLWLATAAETANTNGLVFGSASCGDFLFAADRTACREFGAVEAFAFIAWLALMAYTIALLVCAVRSAGWTATVPELQHAHANPNNTNTNTHTMTSNDVSGGTSTIGGGAPAMATTGGTGYIGSAGAGEQAYANHPYAHGTSGIGSSHDAGQISGVSGVSGGNGGMGHVGSVSGGGYNPDASHRV